MTKGRRGLKRGQAVLSVLVIILMIVPILPVAKVRAATVPSFTFTAFGDIGNTVYSNSSLDNVVRSGSNLTLALGDLGYLSTWGGTEQRWCNIVKAHVGSNFPFELITGNHEDTTPDPDGFIANYAACLPDQIAGISYQAGYGKEYFFDYPSPAPLARIIMIAAGISITGNTSYPYTVNSRSYLWLKSSIESARAKGIPWVIVGMHKDCITIGKMSCEVGPDLMNLLFSERVDLILQAHDHEYQRSKQLVCDDSPTTSTDATFVPSCVVNDGASGLYAKGVGSVIVISGDTGGGEFGTINIKDPEAPYFAAWMGKNSTNPNCGCSPGRAIVKFTVTPTSIAETLVPSTKPISTGTFTTRYRDGFTIGPSLALSTSFSFSPTFPTVGTIINFTAHASGGQLPYTFNWTFGDGATATGTSVTHSYASAGAYNVTSTVFDRTGQTAKASSNVTVSSSSQSGTVILVPAGPGASTVWLPTSTCAGANWACVNEGPVSDGDTSYVRCGSTGCPVGTAATDLYSLQKASLKIPAGSIISYVDLFIIARKSTSTIAVSIAPVLMDGTQTITEGTISLTPLYATYQTHLPTSPFSGSAWTISEIDSLQVGQAFIAGTASARVTSVYIQVGFTTA